MLDRVADLFRTLIDREVVDNAKTVESLLTEGLQAIFDDLDLSVRSEIDIQRGKVAVDLLCLAVSDVLFSLGGSSFSGAAGALQLGVSRVGEQHSQAGLEEHEIQQVLSSFTET